MRCFVFHGINAYIHQRLWRPTLALILLKKQVEDGIICRMLIDAPFTCVFALNYELPLIFNMWGYFSQHTLFWEKEIFWRSPKQMFLGSVMRTLFQLQQNTKLKPFWIVKKGKISDDRDQWNIGWWCLMTNDWASGFCTGVTTVIYSCRSHQSEHFQCSPSSSHFNELGLCFNFPFPPARHFAEKVHPSSSIYQCYSPT